jgi:two-component system, sensor histidine kinase and response regulator
VQKILVIEDQPEIRSNLLELLEAENFQTYEAEDGSEGVQAAQEHLPDLIICDVMMPELDGYDVLNLLRQDSKTAMIPFIFLTAKATGEDLRKGMNLGADDYLSKPFTRTELLGAVNTRLSKAKTFTQHSEEQMMSLCERLSFSIPDKIFDPLDEISSISEAFIRDSAVIKPEDIAALSQNIKVNADYLQRAMKNFFLYMNIEFLACNEESLEHLKDSSTMRPGDFIFMIAMQKANQAGRSKDVKVKSENVQIMIATEDFKKIFEELLNFVLTFSEAKTSINLETFVKNDTFYCSIQCTGNSLSPEMIEQISQAEDLTRGFYEALDPGLGVLLAQRITELYGGSFNLNYDDEVSLTTTVSLPIKPSES